MTKEMRNEPDEFTQTVTKVVWLLETCGVDPTIISWWKVRLAVLKENDFKDGTINFERAQQATKEIKDNLGGMGGLSDYPLEPPPNSELDWKTAKKIRTDLCRKLDEL